MTRRAPDRTTAAAPCPCDPQRRYADCCGRLHAGAAPAADAEALMRSRYSAYVLNLSDYLRDSWHPRTRPARLDLTDAPGARTTWLGLTVHRHTVIDADHAQVEFTARYRVGGTPAQRLRESSRFVCEHGRWYYLDGDIAD